MRLVAAGLGESYEAAHTQLALDSIAVIPARRRLLAEGKITPLPSASQTAADKSYLDTANRLCGGLETLLAAYKAATDPRRKQIYQLWTASTPGIH